MSEPNPKLATAYALSEHAWQAMQVFRDSLRSDLGDISGLLDEEDDEFDETARGEVVTAWAEKWQDVIETLDELPQSPDEPDE